MASGPNAQHVVCAICCGHVARLRQVARVAVASVACAPRPAERRPRQAASLQLAPAVVWHRLLSVNGVMSLSRSRGRARGAPMRVILWACRCPRSPGAPHVRLDATPMPARRAAHAPCCVSGWPHACAAVPSPLTCAPGGMYQVSKHCAAFLPSRAVACTHCLRKEATQRDAFCEFRFNVPYRTAYAFALDTM